MSYYRVPPIDGERKKGRPKKEKKDPSPPQRVVERRLERVVSQKRALTEDVYINMQNKIDDSVDEMLDILIGKAKEGNQDALIFFLSRRLPPDSPIHLDLGEINNLSQAYRALGTVTTAMACGTITPLQGKALRESLLSIVSAAQVIELADRIKDVENLIKPITMRDVTSETFTEEEFKIVQEDKQELIESRQEWWERQKSLRDKEAQSESDE